MRVKIITLLVCLLLVSFVQAQEATPEATPPVTDCNLMPEPRHREHPAIIAFGDRVLDVNQWRIYFIYDVRQQAAIAWTDDNITIVYISHFMYECGFPGTKALREGLQPSYFESIFAQYTVNDAHTVCEIDNLMLTELNGTQNNVPFLLRVWHEPLDTHRMREVRIIVPKSQSHDMDVLAVGFYPDLPACSVATTIASQPAQFVCEAQRQPVADSSVWGRVLGCWLEKSGLYLLQQALRDD